MGYEALIETLLKEGENRSREIVEKARLESDAILREAQNEIERFERSKEEELQKELQARRAKILNRARLEARHNLLKAKYEALDRVFERVETRLRDLIKESGGADSNRQLWTRMVEESLPNGQGTGLKAILDEETPGEFGRILREEGIGCEIVKDPNLFLGFKLISAEGELVVTNSYRTRLEKIKPDLLLELNAFLFGKQNRV
jgi:vacuolar-type H+-ATPase subunit E/Vma4